MSRLILLLSVSLLSFSQLYSQNRVKAVRCSVYDICSGPTEVPCRLNATDPCSCSDERNLTLEDGTFLFHDQLVITSDPPGTPFMDGVFVKLSNWEELLASQDFLDEFGNNLIQNAIDEFNMGYPMGMGWGYFDVNDAGDNYHEIFLGPAVDGVIVVDFWRRGNSHLNIDLVYSLGVDDQSNDGLINESEPLHFEFECLLSSCEKVPTLSQWGMAILAMLFIVLGTVAIRQYMLIKPRS